MPKFVIHGNIFMLQEYDYTYEIEANSAEDAAKQFQDMVSDSKIPIDLDLNQIDKAQNNGGTFHVFSDDTDEDDYFDPDENALISYESF